MPTVILAVLVLRDNGFGCTRLATAWSSLQASPSRPWRLRRYGYAVLVVQRLLEVGGAVSTRIGFGGAR